MSRALVRPYTAVLPSQQLNRVCPLCIALGLSCLGLHFPNAFADDAVASESYSVPINPTDSESSIRYVTRYQASVRQSIHESGSAAHFPFLRDDRHCTLSRTGELQRQLFAVTPNGREIPIQSEAATIPTNLRESQEIHAPCGLARDQLANAGTPAVFQSSLKEQSQRDAALVAAQMKQDKSNLYVLQPVRFATDRRLTPDTTGDFSADRDATTVHFGECDVAIPLMHRLGDLETRPNPILALFSREKTYIELKNTRKEQKAEFYTDIKSANAKNPGKVILFIHGYNVSFMEAAQRSAQLAWDLELTGKAESRGTLMFFSWPSVGNPVPYSADENQADWATTDVEQFLEDLLTQSNVKYLYIIAHSMGSRPTLNGLASLLDKKPELAARIKGVILAAPDIDADTFRRSLARIFGSNKLRGTLYVSANDRALRASKALHHYDRLGDPNAGPVVISGLDTLDATAVDDGDFLGHSYYAERSALLEDLFSSIVNDEPVERRFGLGSAAAKDGKYWRFKPRGN